MKCISEVKFKTKEGDEHTHRYITHDLEQAAEMVAELMICAEEEGDTEVSIKTYIKEVDDENLLSVITLGKGGVWEFEQGNRI